VEKKKRNIFINGAIDPAFIAESIRKHSHKTGIGGHSIFMGQVRADEKESGRVTAIEYTAYEEMADTEAYRIREEIFAKYPLHCLHIHHSLGRVNVGEICLFVFTSATHRREAIQACEELVERIKSELPVWGQEIMVDGGANWKVNT
jgi:molybdopterin synthase catalytic subunit